jgi:hypothetical protein
MQARLQELQRQLDAAQQKQQQLADTVVQQRDLIKGLRGQVIHQSVGMVVENMDAAAFAASGPQASVTSYLQVFQFQLLVANAAGQ